MSDDLQNIYKSISDNAMLSKWAGGLGNDWTQVRALGSHIKGTNGKSQGVVPFLKVANATAVAVNQGGKRKGALCSYLESWHLDIEEFLELRKNTGDERRRTHDMHTANWIPDLFMKRLKEDKEWTSLFTIGCAGIYIIFMERNLSGVTKNMKNWRMKAASSILRDCRQKICGVGCCRCFMKRDILGLLLRTPVTSVLPRNIAE